MPAVDMFARLLGMVIGDLALAHLPYGGIYLCGGVANALATTLRGPALVTGLSDKGRFANFVAEFPLQLIRDDYAALVGCKRVLDQYRSVSRVETAR